MNHALLPSFLPVAVAPRAAMRLVPSAPCEIDAARTAQVRAMLAQILASAVFVRAGRMSRLLTFLVEQHLQAPARGIGEYAVGIEVFDRDPASYCTGDDPVVRVQVGRLRARLLDYYAGAGAAAPLRIDIPTGGYMPRIRPFLAAAAAPLAVRPPVPAGASLLAAPLVGLDEAGAAFARGFNEELAFRVYKTFGAATAPPGAGFRLEGSVRCNQGTARVALRLLGADGHIAWFEQYDRCAAASLDEQEALALLVCAALRPRADDEAAAPPPSLCYVKENVTVTA